MLYHVGETPEIRVFEPRESRTGERLVWAVDREHLANYLLPRDCPRVTFFASSDTDPDDAERFLSGSRASRVIAVESAWLERIATGCVFLYSFTGDGFVPQDGTAGYYVAADAVKPCKEERIDSLLHVLLAENVELRFLPSLWELRERVIRSTLGYSIIRMRNAAPPEAGYEAYRPL